VGRLKHSISGWLTLICRRNAVMMRDVVEYGSDDVSLPLTDVRRSPAYTEQERPPHVKHDTQTHTATHRDEPRSTDTCHAHRYVTMWRTSTPASFATVSSFTS
jgi:hypothetical protein